MEILGFLLAQPHELKQAVGRGFGGAFFTSELKLGGLLLIRETCLTHHEVSRPTANPKVPTRPKPSKHFHHCHKIHSLVTGHNYTGLQEPVVNRPKTLLETKWLATRAHRRSLAITARIT